MKYELRKAVKGEEEQCYAVLDSGRKFQREQGFVQWPDEYPSLQDVVNDMAEGKAYVLTADGEIAGYMYISMGRDPLYDVIEQGEWNTPEYYCVVHRMAFSEKYRNCGLSYTAFSLVEELCRENGVSAMRVDTDFPNERMQHVLVKNGFTYRGIIHFHGPRKAYDKNI